MVQPNHRLFNRANILLVVIVVIVRAVNCQGPSCGYVANVKQPYYEDNAMKSQSAVIVNEIQQRMNGIKELTEEYLDSHFGEGMETFNRQWNRPGVKPLDISLVWNFQDRPDITRSEYTGRVNQVFVPFNRILYHLKNITERAKASASTMQSTDNQAVGNIHSGIKKWLNSVLCPMYEFLAMADRDLHIETSEEIDQHANNSNSLDEEVRCGLLFVYLKKTMDWFLTSSRMFTNS